MAKYDRMEDFDMSRLVLEWEADNEEREEMSREEIRNFACNIYDGDWRAGDTDEEFRVQWPDLTDWELRILKEELQAIEDDIRHKERLDKAYRMGAVEVGGVTYELDYRERIVATYPDGTVQYIVGGDGPEDWAKIVLDGADPVADGWEDGNGNPVCRGAAHRLMEEE